MEFSSSYQFSIILPVLNGGEYIKECVQSILAQSVTDFNLIVLDSGSTDGTIEWLQMQNDERIILQLSDKPMTITENWSRIKNISRNEWMTIIGHDDILCSDYLQTMTALIKQYPDASLYQAHFNLIDAEGRFMRRCKPMEEIQSAKGLLDKILDNDINVYGTGFVMRSKDYDAVGGIPLYPNLMCADYVLWLELTRIVYKATSPNNCFFYRINQSTSATTKIDLYIGSLKLFVDYLLRSKSRLSPSEEKNAYSKRVLTFYCRRISRRLLIERSAKRNDLTVAKFLKETQIYARQFMDEGHLFNPSAIPDVWITKMIDSTTVTRKLYLFIKRIHPNPLLN